MIYPMMMKVDFESVREIGKNPKGLIVTWVVNWLIKPFTMYGLSLIHISCLTVGIDIDFPDLAAGMTAGIRLALEVREKHRID